MIKTPSEAIELLGGWKTVSERIQRPLSTVASWAARNSIPVEVWPTVIGMASEAGKEEITYEVLAQVHAKAAASKGRKKRARAAA